MGRSGTNATIGAMHLGSSAVAFALGKALQEGAQRACDLQAVDEAHAVGQQHYAQRVGQRRKAVLDQASAAKTRLLANRKMLHG